MQTVQNIREKFIELKNNQQFTPDKSGCHTIELIGETFVADEPTIFGELNEDYIRREIRWYLSQSRYVQDIEGKTPQIWQMVADEDGMINSNYGWCIFSTQNNQQYKKVINTLKKDRHSRQAVMIYNRPSMHEDAKRNGRSDFMCTNAVQYLIRDNKLTAVVQMRSNDVVFGYRNDYAWQKYVLDMVAKELNIENTEIVWHVGSLHVYERHFDLVV